MTAQRMMATLASASGLDTTEVAVTLLSHVDGEAGRLVIGGYDVEELAPKISFAALLALLWQGALPGAAGARWRDRQLPEPRHRRPPPRSV